MRDRAAGCGRSAHRTSSSSTTTAAALRAGEVGEFAVHRTQVLVGYWRRPDLYDDAFVDEWFRTGDIGTIDADGFVHVLDRKKDLIIRGGFNIYSAEIERVLSEHPAVAEATVVGAPDERLGEVPVAFVVPRAHDIDRRARRDRVARCHPRHGSGRSSRRCGSGSSTPTTSPATFCARCRSVSFATRCVHR